MNDRPACDSMGGNCFLLIKRRIFVRHKAEAKQETMFAKQITPEFYRALAKALKSARFTPVQEQAPKLIAENCDRFSITDKRMFAYMLATCWHESRFKPIREFRAAEGHPVRQMQDRYWNTGYFGRGYVQLTWKRNYQIWSDITGADLVNFPDRALEPTIAAFVLVKGMNEGLFTGKRLSQYINAERCDYFNARRTVNGVFHADIIEKAAKAIEAVL